jgi:hypothetical protein
MEDIKYYIRVKDKNVGPLSHDDIISKLKKSELYGDDYIFAVGSPSWVQINTIMEFAAFSNTGVTADGVPVKKDQAAWYVHKDKENLGPFLAEKVITMIEKGEIDINDYAYRKGISGWTQIKEIGELSTLMKKTERPSSSSLEKLQPSSAEAEGTGEGISEEKAPQASYTEDTAEYDLNKDAGKEENMDNMANDRDDIGAVNKRNFPELVFGILLILAALLNLSVAFAPSALVAFAGIGFVAYYFIKNKKGVNNAK